MKLKFDDGWHDISWAAIDILNRTYGPDDPRRQQVLVALDDGRVVTLQQAIDGCKRKAVSFYVTLESEGFRQITPLVLNPPDIQIDPHSLMFRAAIKRLVVTHHFTGSGFVEAKIDGRVIFRQNFDYVVRIK